MNGMESKGEKNKQEKTAEMENGKRQTKRNGTRKRCALEWNGVWRPKQMEEIKLETNQS